MDERYIFIPECMVKETGLSGNELIVFAIIYGFSSGGGWFKGSINYLTERTNLSRPSVIAVLKSLVASGHIIRKDVPSKGIKYVDYKVADRWLSILTSQETLLVKNLDLGGKESLPHVVKNLNPKINKQNKNKIKNARARKWGDYSQRTDVDYDHIEKVLQSQISTRMDEDPDDIVTH